MSVELADVVECGLNELAEARGIADRVHELCLLRGDRELLRLHAGIHDQAGRVVGAHRTRGVGHARRLERARIPGGNRLAAYHGNTMVPRVLANGSGAVPDHRAHVLRLGDVRDQLLHRLRVTPLHAS